MRWRVRAKRGLVLVVYHGQNGQTPGRGLIDDPAQELEVVRDVMVSEVELQRNTVAAQTQCGFYCRQDFLGVGLLGEIRHTVRVQHQPCRTERTRFDEPCQCPLVRNDSVDRGVTDPRAKRVDALEARERSHGQPVVDR